MKDKHGSQRLSEKAVGELAESFVKRGPRMALPGFPPQPDFWDQRAAG